MDNLVLPIPRMVSKPVTTARMMTHKLSVRRPLANLIEKNESLMVLLENNVYADIGTNTLFIQAIWR